ncbi:MAG: L-lactate permease [Acidobacteriota bacterium]
MHLPLAISALIGLIPILVVLILMVRYAWSAMKAMPLGWLVAVVLAVIFWRMPWNWILGATFKGFIVSVDILIIIFGAVLLYYDMLESGAIKIVTESVMGLSKDRRIQANLAWLLAAFFEGAAGFGTPGAVVGPLLLGIGFPAMVAAPLVLIFNSTPVSFGCVGIPIWGGVGWTLKTPEIQQHLSAMGLEYNFWIHHIIGKYVGIIHGIIGTFLPLMALYFFIKWTNGKREEFKEALPSIFIAGLVFTVPYTLIAIFIGSELPSLLGSLAGLFIYAVLLKLGAFKYKKIYGFKEMEDRKNTMEESKIKPRISIGVSFLPYILVALSLIITRTIPGIKSFVENNLVITLRDIFGTDIAQSIKLLNNPGLYFIIIVLLSHLFFRMRGKQIKKAWSTTIKRIAPASIALLFAVALSQVMILSGNNPYKLDSMVIMIAKGVATLTGKAYSIFAPFIGILGAYIAGSNTVSNIMFSGFQYATAYVLGLSRTIIVGEQVVGGAVGNMICVHNVVAVCATVGIIGKEGSVIKKNILPAIIYGMLAGIIGTVLIFLSPGLF